MKVFKLLILFLIIANSAFGQILEPVKWDMQSNSIGDDEYELVFTAKIDEEWTIYSQFTADEGPEPTSINYEDESTFEKNWRINRRRA